jgi:hypothetical protein
MKGDTMTPAKKPYYTVCPECGANLDPCEQCTCEPVTPAQKAVITRRKNKMLRDQKTTQEMKIRCFLKDLAADETLDRELRLRAVEALKG